MGKVRVKAHKTPEEDIGVPLHEEDFEQASIDILFDIGGFLAGINNKLDIIINSLEDNKN